VLEEKMEKKVLRLYEVDPQGALKILTEFTSSLAMKEYKRTVSALKPRD